MKILWESVIPLLANSLSAVFTVSRPGANFSTAVAFETCEDAHMQTLLYNTS